MKNKGIIPVVYIILGVFVILAPTVIFPACTGEKMMSCMYTEKAEVGVGIVIVVLGLISIFLSEKVREGISIAIAGIGALVIAFPTTLLGVCKSDMMNCRAATLPLLVVLGILIILVALGNTVYLQKKGRE